MFLRPDPFPNTSSPKHFFAPTVSLSNNSSGRLGTNGNRFCSMLWRLSLWWRRASVNLNVWFRDDLGFSTALKCFETARKKARKFFRRSAAGRRCLAFRGISPSWLPLGYRGATSDSSDLRWLAATSGEQIRWKWVWPKQHEQKNQNLIAHLSDSDWGELQVLIFLLTFLHLAQNTRSNSTP